MRDTREALIQAAQEAFAVDGYGGTSIRRLASAVGIKESSVYKHFPSKAAILEAVIARAQAQMERIAAGMQVPFSDADAAVDVYATIDAARLKRVGEALLHAWLHDPEVVAARRVLTLEQYRSDHVGRMLRDWTVEQAVEFQATLFTGLMERGLCRRADPQAVAFAFWGPLLAILLAAEHGDEAEARRRLDAHIDHFTATHMTLEEQR